MHPAAAREAHVFGFWKRMIDYWKANMSMRLAAITIAVLFLAAAVFELYLQNQYLDFLLETSKKTDAVVLDVEADTVSRSFWSNMQTGATFSLEKDLVNAALDYLDDTGDLSAKLTLTDCIERFVRRNMGELVNTALVRPDGTVVLQKNRAIYNLYSQNYLWNETNRPQLEELCLALKEQLDRDTVPRAAVSSAPNSYTLSVKNATISTTRNLLHIAYALPGNQRNSENLKYILVLTFSLTSVDDFFEKISGMEGDYTSACITDDRGRVLYAQDETWLGESLEGICGQIRSEVLARQIKDTGWSLNLLLDLDAMKASVNARYSKGVWIFMLVILLIGVLQLTLTAHALRPIRRIGKAMKLVKQGVWQTRIEVKGEDEIWKLARNYNDMADALEEWRELNRRQNEEKLESVRQTADAQMHALQSQINAHFLCNTLNAINMSAVEQGNEEVSMMLRMLSDIMRYAYSRSCEEVTLGDEVRWVSQYLALQKFRLMDVFNYRVEFPEEYLEWPCCKLFLQPFVENSIKHGFASKQSGCFISVTGEMDGDRMKIVIEDNGCGMTPEVQEKVRAALSPKASMRMEGTGIGIENVAARLRIFYGSRLSMELQSREGEGTVFCLYLPIPENMSHWG